MSIFIRPPYIKCPKCKKESFGVIGIYEQHYCRRCKECYYPKPGEPLHITSLPKLKKKIIYLDQCAISEMMKVLNPKTKAYKKGNVDKYWIIMFEKLDVLCKLQLIICPFSESHIDESLLSEHYEPLRRIYEHLAHGIEFTNYDNIISSQICKLAKNWINGKIDEEIEPDIQTVVNGDINTWQDRFFISMNSSYLNDFVDDVRQNKQNIHDGLSGVFKGWQNDQNKEFYDWFNEESMSYGKTILLKYLTHVINFNKKLSNNEGLTFEDIDPHPAVWLVLHIHNIFKKAGIEEDKIPIKIIEFLLSPSLKNVPFIKIQSLLYSALARKAASGQKSLPSPGMTYDVRTISALLPYCDAMFIDSECHTFLKERPLCDKINYETKIFSVNNKLEFLKYLNEIKHDTPKEHFEKVKEVYGEDWPEPYTTMFAS